MSIKNKKGFTLIELIIVVIIIAILSGVAFANYQKAIQQARYEEAKAALRMIQVAQKIHQQKFGNIYQLPGTGTVEDINRNLNLNLKEGYWVYDAQMSPNIGMAYTLDGTKLWHIDIIGEPICDDGCQ